METKKCPYCGGEIMLAAKKCKHCGEWLNAPIEVPGKKQTIYEQESNDDTSSNTDITTIFVLGTLAVG